MLVSSIKRERDKKGVVTPRGSKEIVKTRNEGGGGEKRGKCRGNVGSEDGAKERGKGEVA